MKRRSRAGGEQIKGRRRKTPEPKRRNAPKAAPRPNATHSEKETEVVRLARELNEALERQTATSEVLNVISSSSGELDPVFNAILQNAARICQAQFGILNLYDGTAYRTVALHNAPQNFARTKLGETFRPHPDSGLAYVARNKQVAQIDDIRTRQPYIEGDKTVVELADIAGARTLLIVPMLNKDKLVGTISIYRQEVRPFIDKQIELVKNFAAQAVIAIENARLLNELRQRTTDLTERTADLTEALEQQMATSEVLQAISSFPGDLEPVFATMLENAVRICDAKFGNIYRRDGETLRLAATHNAPPAYAEARRRSPHHRLSPQSFLGRMAATKAVVHVADIAADQGYIEHRVPETVLAVELGGVRTFLAVPMLKQNELIGVFTLFRQEVRPFSDKQIALVTNFAAQAVIAIENARLLNELRQRTTDLTEALEQQTATSEVLQVISASPGDLEPVFEAMVEKAVRICDATFGDIFRWEGDSLHLVSSYNTPAAFAEVFRRLPVLRPGPSSLTRRMLETKTYVHVPDLLADPAYVEKTSPHIVAAAELGGARTLLAVPMFRRAELVGQFILNRQEVRPFTDKQIALVTNFAAQAVIAIENARLLNELRQRTTDLTEALEQQTATSNVLQVISSSPGDLEPVFATMLESAATMCDAKFGNIFRWDGDVLNLVATYNTPPAFFEHRKRTPFRPDPEDPIGRMICTKAVVHVADLAAERRYVEKSDPNVVAAVELAGIRTFAAVPMLKENELIGAIIVYRQEVRPFTEKHIELVTNFAAQAVIAIENARLLNELRQSLEQQTATANVLQVISRFPGDLQPVFATMLEQAVRICEASFGSMVLREGDMFRRVAIHDAPPAFVDFHESRPTLRLSDAFVALDQILRTKQVVQIGDAQAEEPETPIAKYGDARTLLTVPLLKENEVIGALGVYRQEVRLFSDKQIALVENFAAQAVIAIENARLLNELRQRTDDLSQRTTDLTETLEQQTATSHVLEVISRSAFDLQAVFETVAESSVRLCGADRAFIFRFDGELLRMVVGYNSTPGFVEWVAKNPIRPGRHSASARAALERRTIHIADVLADPEYVYGAKDVEPIRTVLGVPILKGDYLLGLMMIYRLEVRPFTDRQIALVETFADQAAIAIENVRLLDALRERTEEVEKLNQHLEQRVTDQVGEIERMGRLRRFLPPQVADLIVASGTEKQLESHRREITALFCDLRGFTGFSESADPEDVMTVLREYHEALGASIIRYSGTLERYAGDGVMVVFNDPVPVENPALQAVLMALEMREAIGALTETWRRWGHDIGFGIGIAHGFATLGTIGFEGRFDYAAIGTVSNVASRLCDEAKPGQILISPRVLTKVENAVTVEPVGEFELKGIRRPLAAYNVVAASPSKV
jgi:GAF domain-containing protein